MPPAVSASSSICLRRSPGSAALCPTASASSCPVPASQVELQFVLCPSSSSASAASACSVSVQAPNGEQCVLALARRSSSAGRTARFCARSPGCGHGRWRVRVQDARTQALLAEQELWLDGLGTLSFEVPALRLREQEFLRMPDACRECPGHRRFDQ